MVGKRKHTKKLGSNHHLFEITLDITNTESLITHMDAFYFQFKEVSKNGITVGMGLCPTLSFNNSTSEEVLYKKDMVCGFVLRHNDPRDYHYVTTLDWKELCINQNNPNAKVDFYYPNTNYILSESTLEDKTQTNRW